MRNVTRRNLLKVAGVAGGVLVVRRFGIPSAMASPSGTSPMPGANIPKYELPLVIPPAMPRASRLMQRSRNDVDYYEIAVRQFAQQVLPPSLERPPTTVWSYGAVNDAATFHYPAFTIEAKWRRPVRVKWINDLKDSRTGAFLPHLLAVDPTLHWANPPGGVTGRDSRPTYATTPGPYTGPVPIVTHLHGAEGVAQESDGFAEAWFLPAATDIPSGYANTGTFYEYFKAASPLGDEWEEGAAVFEYENDQRATTLWYHDHTLGMTRTNVYAGPAGFYLLRGGPDDLRGSQLPGPAPREGDPPGTKYFEIPLAIQDRAFNDDASLFYPESRAFFDGFVQPYIPFSDVPPIWNPEFFGNAIVVNGRTWPFLEVEKRRYRFRILNGCNSRFLILTLGRPGMPIWVIGTEGGFLPAPVPVSQLLLAPAERADVIVDFTDVPLGTEIVLLNLGPDEPFAGGAPNVDFLSADPDTTGQVMLFRVAAEATERDRSQPPERLRLPRFTPLGDATAIRSLGLGEMEAPPPGSGPTMAELGTIADGTFTPRDWGDAITENPAVGAIEVWELYNLTGDAHPIHIHELQFQVVDRQPFDGAPRPPEPQETGFKDTVIAYPGEITRVKVQFRRAGLFVWHCHIVEHEDNEMMRPYHIGPIPRGLP